MARDSRGSSELATPSARRQRVLRGAAWSVLWTLVFMVMLVVSALVHVDTRALRSSVAAALNGALSGTYRGRVEVSEIDALGAFRAGVREVRVLGEAGEPLLNLSGVKLQYQPLQLLRAALGAGNAPLVIDHLRVDESRVVVALDADTGEWSLVRALSKPPGARPPRPGRVPTIFSFSTIEIGKLELIAAHPSFGKLEARIDRVQGSATVGGAENSVTVERFGVRLEAPDGSNLDGTGSFRLLPKGFVAGTFHGFLEGTELDASARADGGVLTLRLAIPLALPEQVRRRLPGWPLQVPLAAEVEARGPPEALALEARLRAQNSHLELDGMARLTAPASAHVRLRATGLDSRLFWPAAPPVTLDADADADVRFEPTGPKAVIEGETQPTAIGGVPLPGTTFTLTLEPEHVRAQLRGADARGAIEATLEHSARSPTALSLSAQRIVLRDFPGLGLGGRLDASLEAQLAGTELSGEFDANVRALRAGTASLEEGRATGSFAGRLDELRELQLDVRLSAARARIGGVDFDTATISTHGSPWRSRFESSVTSGSGQGKAAGLFHLDDHVWLSDVEATWSTPALALVARAGRVAPELRELHGGVFELSGSAGRASGKLDATSRSLRVEADTEAFDLGALARALGLGEERLAGRVSGRAELVQERAGESRGALDVQVRDFGARDVTLGTFELEAHLAGNQLELELATQSSALGALSASSRLQLAGSALARQSWERATGQLSAKLVQLPLWPLGLVAAKHSRVKDLDGRLEAAVQLERSDPASVPNIFVQAGTTELTFDLARDAAGSDEQRAHFDRFAVHTSASLNGASGHGVATLVVTDEHGALVTTSGSLELDLDALLANPQQVIEQIVQTPLDALIRLHPRPLSHLPPPLSSPDLAGTVEGTLQLRGSLADPTLSLSARATQLLGSFADKASAVDVTAGFDYAPNTGRLVGQADVVQAGQRLVAARLEGRVPNPLSNEHALRDAEVSAAAMLNGVPLELLPAAARNEITGRLYGSVDIERRRDSFEQRAHVEIGGLSVGAHVLGNGRLTLRNRGDGVRAELWLGASRRELRATLTGEPPREGAPLAFEGSVVARDFDAASLSPLVSDILTDVSGDMNAELKFSMRPSEDDTWYLGIDGEARLTRGAARLDLFGLDLREMDAIVRARSTPDYTVIQVERMNAHSRSRSPNVAGDAEIWLRGVRVVNGEANLSLSEVPLSVKGAQRGTARGVIRARLERQPDHMALEVKLPNLRITLPASSARTLIGLDDNPEIQVLQTRAPPEHRSRDALLWKMAFSLGNDVRIRRADLDIPLTGEPRLDFQHALRPSGTIEVAAGGRISLFDQTFAIDRGVVQFVPDEPDNPRVDLTASWRAPDGTTVYVDITGTAKHATVLTRDDRGLEDVERFYLLTGNAARAAPTGPSFDEGANEDAAIGKTFALGVNELLKESVGNLRVSVGTTHDDRASYGASVRLSDKLTFQGNFQPASENRDEQSANDLTGTLDYRVSRNWSLRTELGTSGGAFDLLWSHRY